MFETHRPWELATMKALEQDDIKIVPGTAPRADVAICWRYTGQPIPSTASTGLVCDWCRHCVVADPNTLRFALNGASVMCRECALEQ